MLFKTLKFRISAYFGFSSAETNGFIVLLFLMAVFSAFSFVNVTRNTYTDEMLKKDRAILDSALALLEKEERKSPHEKRGGAEKSGKIRKTAENFVFDPNTASEQEFERLGLARFLAARIVKYREKGGVFYQKEDFKKIYGMEERDYERLSAYIRIPKKEKKQSGFPEKSGGFPKNKSGYAENNAPYPQNKSGEAFKRRPVPGQTDINLADTLALQAIKGIGSKLSARIIKFRDALGGFHSKSQIAEVYGLPEETIAELNKYCFVASGFVPKKIRLNTASWEEMKNHPYIGYKNAKGIAAYRKQHGPFTGLDGLAAIIGLEVGLVEKMKPYLEF